jgi:putative N-acetylmannosamine-6-phosphate epimerase
MGVPMARNMMQWKEVPMLIAMVVAVVSVDATLRGRHLGTRAACAASDCACRVTRLLGTT